MWSFSLIVLYGEVYPDLEDTFACVAEEDDHAVEGLCVSRVTLGLLTGCYRPSATEEKYEQSISIPRRFSEWHSVLNFLLENDRPLSRSLPR
jgi:hypothetical protein